MVSFIQSNYTTFGAGVAIPGTGISLQNRGANFSLEENSDNCLTGGKRSYHTIIPGFMIQGGDPEGTGMGGAKENIKGEFAQNGVKNDLKHTRGVISMARSMMPDSASSQFFIMHKDAPHLDGGYAAFGKVVDGMDAVDEIADTEVDWNDKPTTPQVMKRVYIED